MLKRSHGMSIGGGVCSKFACERARLGLLLLVLGDFARVNAPV